MVTLTHIAGLPLMFNLEKDHLIFDQDEVSCHCTRDVALAEMIPALLNKALRYPEQVYSYHNKLHRLADVSGWPADFVYDVYYMPAGLLGIEFIKTHIFHVNQAYAQASCLVQVLQGRLTIILQKNKQKNDPFEINTSVEEARILEVGPGDKLAIPSGYYYTFINAHEVPVVFARVIGQEHIINYQALRRENGLAYYLISKNAKQELVSNPRYRENVDIKKISVKDLNLMAGYTATEIPLYEELKGNLTGFRQMLARA